MLSNILLSTDFMLLSRGLLAHVGLTEADKKSIYQALLAGQGDHLPKRRITLSTLERRNKSIRALEKEFGDFDDPSFQQWLKFKQQESELLSSVRTLQQTRDSTQFLQKSYQIYGSYDQSIFAMALQYSLAIAEKADKHATMLSDVKKLFTPVVVEPTHQKIDPVKFDVYRQNMALYFAKSIDTLYQLGIRHERFPISARRLQILFDALLDSSGAKQRGWNTKIIDHHTDRISVNPLSKQVNIANKDFFLRPRRLLGLLLHEVGIHVSRKENKQGFAAVVPVVTPSDVMREEGLGVLVEQLCLQQFVPLRHFRYLAIGLAIGVDGRPRSLFDTYEVIWRLRYLTQKEISIERSKHFAAIETMRIFRGLAPDVPGAVLLRDMLYVKGNRAIWDYLMSAPATYDILAGLLDGSPQIEVR